MKLTIIALTALLTFFSGSAMAVKWIEKEVTGNLKPYPGCRDKAEAMKKASSEVRFNKYSRILCEAEGYGWNREKVISKGEVTCEECEGEEYQGKYRCYMANVKLLCKRLSPGD